MSHIIYLFPILAITIANPTLLDRLWRDFRALVRGELAELPFYGTYSYMVNTVYGDGSIQATPTDPTVTVPPIDHVAISPGLLGETVTAAQGMIATVIFLNGKASGARVTGFEGNSISQAAITPQSGAVSPAARVNDAVSIIFPPLMQFSGVMTPGPPPAPTAAIVGIITIVQPAVGVISSGSTVTGIGG